MSSVDHQRFLRFRSTSSVSFFGRRGKVAAAALAVLLGIGCASVDFDYPRTPSHTVESTGGNHLGRQFAEHLGAHPGESGFVLLIDSIDALAVRLLMAERADRTLDVQYYLISKEEIGYLFLGALLKAADRGVRVRLLLDDIQTQGHDAGMAGLDSHPNFEVRIFNPFAGRSSRIGDGLTDFRRVNRRMHNKSFTVDNQLMLIGGRNIAAEYFGAREDVNFGDLDVAGIGPVVGEVSAMFDSYWNNRAAVPLPGFAKMPKDSEAELVDLRQQIAKARRGIETTRYAAALTQDIRKLIETDASVFTWAPYELVYDSPDKVHHKKAKEAASILTPLRDAVEGAERELLFLSPYFVPRKSGIKGLGVLRDRDVEITVITNSLAATNHSVVHSGYAPARKPLLEMGVELYEVRPDAKDAGAQRAGNFTAAGTLHTKAFVIDRERLFLGSFNLDPRSAYINTELGVIIDSEDLAGIVVDRVDRALPSVTYKVVLGDNGKLRWESSVNGKKEIWTKEPETSFWRRLGVRFMRILPIKGQL